MTPTGSKAPGDAPAEPGVSRSAWYSLGVLTLVYTCHSIDRSVFAVLTEPIKHEFSLTDGQLGALTGLAFGLFYAAAGLPLGLLIDRMNRRNLLAVLVFFWSGFTVLCGLAQNYWHLLFARLGVGMAESGGSPAAMSMLTDLFPPKRRSTAIGVFWMSASFGGSIALALGGYVAHHYGWRAAFFVAGLPGLILVLLLLLTTREPERGATEGARPVREKPPSLAETWRHAIRNRVFVCAFLGMTANSMVGVGINVWQVSFLVRVHQFDLATAGLIVGAIVICGGGASTFLGGVIADRIVRRRGLRGAALVPMTSGLLTAATGLYMVTASTPLTGVIGFALWEVSFRLYFGPGNNLMLSSVSPRMRGVTVSASQAAAGLVGAGCGPMLIGLVSDAMLGSVGPRHSLQWGIGAVLVFSLVAALMFALAARARPSVAQDAQA